MIQRIQSVWLLLASLSTACMFLLNVLSISYEDNGGSIDQSFNLFGYSYMLSILGIVLVILPLIAIFLFKNRKKQAYYIVFSIVLNIGFMAWFLMSVKSYIASHDPALTSSSYGIGAFLPIASVILLFMAWRGVRKDEKLVKSLDRLR